MKDYLRGICIVAIIISWAICSVVIIGIDWLKKKVLGV